MNILVTGGAGFIGSHLIERLLSRGDMVVCLDNFDDYYDPCIKRKNIKAVLSSRCFRLVEGDLRDEASLEESFLSSIDVVVHLAARAGVRFSLLQPELYFDVNVMGTLRLLESMRRHHVSKMVFASSSSVYGDASRVPFSESEAVNRPISPYAASKKSAEVLCHTYAHLYGFDIFCLRFFTVYGPRQRPEMAIHQFVGKIIQGEPICLYGNGASQRDYTYIDDILAGLMGSIENVRGYEIINLGGSHAIPLCSLITRLEETIGKKAVVKWLPMQDGDMHTTCADISKAKQLLGYCPKVPLQEGLKLFVEWYQHSLHL